MAELLGRRGEAGGRPAELQELQEAWEELRLQAELRHQRLQSAHAAQLFYCDAAEAEAWMGEQELHMMAQEKAKVPGGPAMQHCIESLRCSPAMHPIPASLCCIPVLHPCAASLH